ncbi:MAG: ATP-dependent sacrificial sulfur transferase LarE [Nitrospirae bacterium]|nr:MAG: ATP-dependent sacrificial sulfur transferase LarE [Nitrospirota bacterium]
MVDHPALFHKYEVLRDIFRRLGSSLVAFSGGIDSSLLLKVAHETLGEKAIGVTAVSPTFPAIELETVRRVAEEIGAALQIVETDQLQIAEFVRNDASRCFHCKTDLYQRLDHIRRKLGFEGIVDGTHLDDLGDDRPGVLAARAFGVRSPLVEAGLGKSEIRALAKALGLSNWDKPAAACLSSRIPRGSPISRMKLARIERAEALLLREGVRQVRVRDHDGIARIELDPDSMALLHDPLRRERIAGELKAYGFRFVTLDLEGYRSGSTNG